MKTLIIIALCCAMGSAWAGQRQTILTVSLTIEPAACPEGVTAPSCAPFTKTTTVADSYSVARPTVAGDGVPTITKIDGKATIVTLSY